MWVGWLVSSQRGPPGHCTNVYYFQGHLILSAWVQTTKHYTDINTWQLHKYSLMTSIQLFLAALFFKSCCCHRHAQKYWTKPFIEFFLKMFINRDNARNNLVWPRKKPLAFCSIWAWKTFPPPSEISLVLCKMFMWLCDDNVAFLSAADTRKMINCKINCVCDTRGGLILNMSRCRAWRMRWAGNKAIPQ